MPFIPHTEADVQAMLAAMGVPDIESLFCEIPEALRIDSLEGIPDGLNEFELNQHVELRMQSDAQVENYAGGGAYEHFIPAVVWDLVSRGEFLTAYTPYQAEASQGTLQLLFEYQTMMASLMGHEVSNASLYDGATAVVEAVLMAVRLSRQSQPVVFVPDALHPNYRRVLDSLLAPQGVAIEPIPFAISSGHTTIEALDAAYQKHKNCTALLIPQPNFFGILEEASMLTDWVHAKGGMAIGVVNPVAMACLKPPGQWGEKGADMACGEGQPLGVPLNRGGPYFGFLTCQKKSIRQLPGRLVGQTTDSQQNVGYTLTLQAREQHIRRGKATSNICTNQGLLVTAATIYMSLLGAEGLKQVALKSHHNTQYLNQLLSQLPTVKTAFNRPSFHEIAIHCPISAKQTVEKMIDKGYFPGIDISSAYPELDHTLIICATETKTKVQIEQFVEALQACWES